MKRKLFLLFICLGISLTLCFVLSVLQFYRESQEIKNNILRMHIVANSDSDTDQQLKLKVRDRILEYSKQNLFEASDSKQAQRILEENKNEIRIAALQTVRENGYDYNVEVYIGKCFFPTRTYNESITLPAGKYEAVNVIIGEGKGQNFWCIMFPPMCVSAASEQTDIGNYLTESQTELVKTDPKYEPKFKIIEIIEKIKENCK